MSRPVIIHVVDSQEQRLGLAATYTLLTVVTEDVLPEFQTTSLALGTLYDLTPRAIGIFRRLAASLTCTRKYTRGSFDFIPAGRSYPMLFTGGQTIQSELSAIAETGRLSKVVTGFTIVLVFRAAFATASLLVVWWPLATTHTETGLKPALA